MSLIGKKERGFSNPRSGLESPPSVVFETAFYFETISKLIFLDMT